MTDTTVSTNTVPTDVHEFTENHVNYILRTFNTFDGSDEDNLRKLIALVQSEAAAKADRLPAMVQAADYLAAKKNSKAIANLNISFQHARNTIRKFNYADLSEEFARFSHYRYVKVVDFETLSKDGQLSRTGKIRLHLVQPARSYGSETETVTLDVPATWLFADPVAAAQTVRKSIRAAQAAKKVAALKAAQEAVKAQKESLVKVTEELKKHKQELAAHEKKAAKTALKASGVRPQKPQAVA